MRHPETSFYVYIVFRPDGSPCYVGKGKGYRWRFHLSRSHNKMLRGIVAKAGGVVPIVVVRGGMSEADAFQTEMAFIAAIGRFPVGPLVNLNDGGAGMAGHKQSPETIEKRVSKIRGKSRPRDVVERIAAANRGRKRSDETRAKLSRPKSAAHRKALSEARDGIVFSDQHRANIGAALRGRKRPPEVGAKVRASMIGVKHTEERRANLRASNRSRDPDVRDRIRAGVLASIARKASQQGA
jgi:hypothetical protein